LQAFGPGIVMMLLSAKSEWVHVSIGRTDRLLRWTGLRFVFGTSCLLVGLQFGARGVAVGSVVALYVLTVPGLLYAVRPVGLELRQSFLEIFKYMAAGILSGLSAWILFYSDWEVHFDVLDDLLLGRIVLSCAFVFLCYGILTVVFVGNFRVYRELASLRSDIGIGRTFGSRN
jgi:hypothetical protein